MFAEYTGADTSVHGGRADVHEWDTETAARRSIKRPFHAADHRSKANQVYFRGWEPGVPFRCRSLTGKPNDWPPKLPRYFNAFVAAEAG